MRALIVEDEPRLRETLRKGLVEDGFAVDAVGTKKEAENFWAVNPYDFLVLDLGLPDGDGLDLLREARREGKKTPVLVLTARDTVSERVSGLDGGADDYLVKPFAFEEFLARCRALSRRGPATSPPVVVVFDLELDPATHRVTAAGEVLESTAKEFALLLHLARRPARIHSKMEILEACWDEGYEGVSNVVEVHVASLRRKLRSAGSRVEIRVLRNLGYRLES